MHYCTMLFLEDISYSLRMTTGMLKQQILLFMISVVLCVSYPMNYFECAIFNVNVIHLFACGDIDDINIRM